MEKVLKLQPHFSHTVWGGSRLRTQFGYDEPGEDIGECWGISAHPSGDCLVKGGPYDGKKLSELWAEHRELFGDLPGEAFPLLVKLIDAKSDLSIQVHPDDAYARANENGSVGKTECWIVLDCPEDASLVLGHHAESREQLERMVRGNQWKKLIREIPVRKGDFIQLDPGTVHAIKGGVMVLETQQSCDITYRLYDYDRIWNGKPRMLHIDQSLDVITVPAKEVSDCVCHPEEPVVNEPEELCSCSCYTVYRAIVRGRMAFPAEFPFLNVSILAGEGRVCGEEVRKGDHLIVTAGAEEFLAEGDLELVLSRV